MRLLPLLISLSPLLVLGCQHIETTVGPDLEKAAKSYCELPRDQRLANRAEFDKLAAPIEAAVCCPDDPDVQRCQ
jgi:hypothetical protein